MSKPARKRPLDAWRGTRVTKHPPSHALVAVSHERGQVDHHKLVYVRVRYTKVRKEGPHLD
jgi:hypothetical protein